MCTVSPLDNFRKLKKYVVFNYLIWSTASGSFARSAKRYDVLYQKGNFNAACVKQYVYK